MSVYKAVMAATGNWSGSWKGGPPEAPTLRTTGGHGAEHVIASNNDGFEVWFGYPNKWNHHIDQREARQLFWWLLWEWFAKARWFGLRRPIYYWALRRHVAEFQRVGRES